MFLFDVPVADPAAVVAPVDLLPVFLLVLQEDCLVVEVFFEFDCYFLSGVG